MANSTIPIPSSITDPFYRYKRNKLEIVIKNKNGGQTSLENIDQIASQLHVSTSELTKAIAKGTGCGINKNVISGIIDIDKLEIILEKFIRANVLCSNCNLPELGIRDGFKSCNACGFQYKGKRSVKNESKISDKKKTESSHKIDDAAGKIIHRIDDLLTKTKVKELIDQLHLLESECWKCETENDLNILREKMASIESSL
jgi:translation initiation factor 2 beta subunit (eIF-2beta)/eIF-5